MTDESRGEIVDALRDLISQEAAKIRAAISQVEHRLAGMSPDVAVQEVGRILRPLLYRENIGRFAVAEVLAEYVVRERLDGAGHQ